MVDWAKGEEARSWGHPPPLLSFHEMGSPTQEDSMSLTKFSISMTDKVGDLEVAGVLAVQQTPFHPFPMQRLKPQNISWA